MKRLKWIPFVVAALLAAPLSANATPLIELSAPDSTRAYALLRLGLDIVSHRGPTLQAVGWEQDIAKLEARGIDYKILLPDLEADIRRAAQGGIRPGRAVSTLSDTWTLGLFPGYANIIAWRDSLLHTYPDLMSEPDTLGYTFEGRPIWAFKLSDNPNQDESEPEIFLNGAIHCREVITPLLLMAFTDTLLQRYQRHDPRTVSLVDDHEIWILPLINIDGYLYNESIITDADMTNGGGGLWRKNRRPNSDGSFGVDLNRNFPFMWGLNDLGSSPIPEQADYRGASAASEPETQAIMDFVNAHHFEGVINYHSYSNLILHPWGYTYDPPADLAIYRALGNYLNETLGWTVGGAEAIYLTNGDAADWQAAGGMTDGADYPMWSYTIEVGDWYHDNGFWPNTVDIRDRLVTGQLEPLFRFCEKAPDPYPLLPPPTPLLAAERFASDSLRLQWARNGDNFGNRSLSFEIGSFSGLTDGDDAESDSLTFWAASNFSRDANLSDNGTTVWYSGNVSDLHSTLTSILPVRVTPENSTLSFDTYYSIEEGWDYGYVQVSLDGEIFENLKNEQTDADGGLTGYAPSWMPMTFSLADYLDQDVYLRFVYDSDVSINEGGWQIDNIRPVVGFTDFEIAQTTGDTVYTAVAPGSGSQAYCVRGIDAESDTSHWSLPVYLGDFNAGTPTVAAALPARMTLESVYPNPFNSTVSFLLQLSGPMRIRWKVVDILGRTVVDQPIGSLGAGQHRLHFDGHRLASGAYFVQIHGTDPLSGERWSQSRKIILLR